MSDQRGRVVTLRNDGKSNDDFRDLLLSFLTTDDSSWRPFHEERSIARFIDVTLYSLQLTADR